MLQSFFISIQPVDDAMPHLVNHGLRVQEGIRKTISEFELQATDQDTEVCTTFDFLNITFLWYKLQHIGGNRSLYAEFMQMQV